MNLFRKIFTRPSKIKIDEIALDNNVPTIEMFPHLQPNKKLTTILILGDTGKTKYFPYLKYAILEEENINIKFAALKRIHLFEENHSEAVKILNELKNTEQRKSLEPYFTMALSRLGLITLEEFNQIINSLN